jgi:hypothetical protein
LRNLKSRPVFNFAMLTLLRLLKTLPTSLPNLKCQAYRSDKKIINGILRIQKNRPESRKKNAKARRGKNIAEGRLPCRHAGMPVLTMRSGCFRYCTWAPPLPAAAGKRCFPLGAIAAFGLIFPSIPEMHNACPSAPLWGLSLLVTNANRCKGTFLTSPPLVAPLTDHAHGWNNDKNSRPRQS